MGLRGIDIGKYPQPSHAAELQSPAVSVLVVLRLSSPCWSPAWSSEAVHSHTVGVRQWAGMGRPSDVTPLVSISPWWIYNDI